MDKNKRCKHRNGLLIEFYGHNHSRIVEDGIVEAEGVNEHGNITGYGFACRDCGQELIYMGYRKRRPAWIDRLIDQL